MEQARWLPNIQVRNMLDALPAKHVFLVSDACFSGDILNAQRGAGPLINSDYYRRAYAKVSRQVMTSGASESVPDASEFALRLKSSLRRAEGACIDPQYLFGHAREVRQTQPLLGTIQGGEHQEGGSFLFFRKQGGAAVAVTPPVVTPKPAPAPTPAPRPAPAAPPEHPVPADFVKINGGTFAMGSPDNETGRGNVESRHQVTVKSFYVGKYEVTQKEWREVMGNNPSHFKGDNLPVEQVSWYDAVEYCNRRSEREGLIPAYTVKGKDVSWDRGADGYRLPTEAEWEYAAKGGGLDFLEYEYAGGNNVDAPGWYNGNSGSKTHPVGTKAANSLGIYDMSGNVWEWCWDRYGAYSSGAQSDPAGAASGTGRVGRGGSWDNGARGLRSTFRVGLGPSVRINILGFRLVRP
jgi:formylglycine-generating enzyme required for sulfatase activity